MIVLTIRLSYGIEVRLIAAFHNAIAGTVPQIVELLKNMNYIVQSAGINVMEKLIEHGK